MKSIPRSFELMGFKYRVERVPGPDLGDRYGEIDYDRQVIRIAKWSKTGPSAALLLQTFCHELAHGLLFHMGYPSLADDEKFVDQLGHALHQFLITKSNKD